MTATVAPNINDFWGHYKSLEKLSDSTTSDVSQFLMKNFRGLITCLDESALNVVFQHQKDLCKKE